MNIRTFFALTGRFVVSLCALLMLTTRSAEAARVEYTLEGILGIHFVSETGSTDNFLLWLEYTDLKAVLDTSVAALDVSGLLEGTLRDTTGQHIFGSAAFDLDLSYSNVRLDEPGFDAVARSDSTVSGTVSVELVNNGIADFAQFAINGKEVIIDSSDPQDWHHVYAEMIDTGGFFMALGHFSFYNQDVFKAWIMGSEPVNIFGDSYATGGDFHAAVTGRRELEEIPEPNSLVLLGMALLGGLSQRRSA